jgi:hypothetical protein
MWALGIALVVLTWGNAAAADEWFVIGERTITSANPSMEIKAEAGKFLKEDIKKTKITVEGADVEITKIDLKWNNMPDDTVANLGILKSGGETIPKDAPGREATLMSVVIQYKILNNATTALVKVWGYD